MSQRRKIFLTLSLDVEEEGLFGGCYQVRNVTVRNTASLVRLAPLLERGARPTLFCAWPVFADPDSRRMIAGLRDRHGAEIAAHLHHWNTPPFQDPTPDPLDDVSTGRLALPAMAAKLAALFRAGQEFQSAPLTSFRMGRWDLRREHWPLLAELGVRCDASVRPLHDLGPDHYQAPSDPYWVEVNGRRILEVPLSVTPLAGWLPGLAGRFVHGRKSLKNWGALALLPVYHPLWLMKAMTRLFLARGGQVLSLTWHSSEMMPGGTPHLADEAAVSALMTRIVAYTDWLCSGHDLHFARMDELPALVGPTAPCPVSASGDWTYGQIAGASAMAGEKAGTGESFGEARILASSQAILPGLAQARAGTTDSRPGTAAETGPLPPGLPHIAYLLLWYPLFTQPFIFREVEALRRHLPLTVYSLYDANLRHCSAEMLAVAGRTRRMGIRALPRLLKSLLCEAFCHPRRLAGLIAKCLGKRWPSLEIFGENLWALVCGVHLGRLLRQDGIDMIHAPWPRGTATAARVASAISGIPFSIAARGDNLAPADPDLVDKLGEASFVRANNAADKSRILELCPQLAANVEQGQGRQAVDRIPLVYNSLTLSMPKGGDSRQKTGSGADGSRGATVHLLALGRFDVTKGFDILLHACAILKDQGLDFALTLAGGGGKLMGLGDLETSLTQLRESLGLQDLVRMPGLVSHNELPAILDAHDIFVAPCVIDPSGKRDGIPNTVIEAMSWGLPVVASKINALPEIVRDRQTGLLVPPGDERALAKALAGLAGDPALRRELGNNARKLARSMFDPESNSQRLAAMFRNFFDPKGTGRRGCAG